MLPWKCFCPDSVYCRCEVVVGYGGVPRLYRPHWFTQCPHRGAGVEHYLRPVDPVKQPVERVVPAVADVDGNLAVDRGEYPGSMCRD